MANGPGRACRRDDVAVVATRGTPATAAAPAAADEEAGVVISICTCILHFTSSIGVLFAPNRVSTTRTNIQCQGEGGGG